MQVKYLSGGTHRHDRGRLHRAPEPGDCFVFAGRAARVRAHAGHDGLRAPRHASKRHRAALERQQDAAVDRAGRRGAASCSSGAAAGRLLRARAAGRAADAADAARGCRRCRTPRHAAGRALPLARRPPPLPLSVRRPPRAPRAGAACWPGGWRSDEPEHLLASRSTTTASSCSRAEPLDLAAAARRGALFATDDLLHDVLASLNSRRAGAAALPRDRARRRAWSSPAIPARRRARKQLQASSALFYEVFRKYDAGNLLLAQAEARGAGAGARICAAARQRCSACARRRSSSSTLRAPSPFALPLMVERFRETADHREAGGPTRL